MELTKGVKYNVAYKKYGWIGNFNAGFIKSDLVNSYFADDNMNIIVIQSDIIIFAIPCTN